MRILLIRPPQVRWHNESRRVGTPLGLLSIAAVLGSHDVSLLDAAAEGYDTEVETAPGLFRFGLSRSELAHRIGAYAPDLVGIAATMTSYWGTTLEVVDVVRQAAPGAHVLLGGHHASATAEMILMSQGLGVDAVVVGEGERGILSYMEYVEGGARGHTGS